MRNRILRTLPFVSLAAMLMITTGCLAVSGPKYPSYKVNPELESVKQAQYKQNGVNLMLPEGWKEQPLPPNADKRLKAVIKKDGYGILNFFCGGMLVKNEMLRDVALAGSTPEAEVLAGPYSIEASGYKPGFEIRMEKAMHEGKQANYMGLYAWKGSNGFTCNYYVVGVGLATSEKAASELTKEFILIVKNMK